MRAPISYLGGKSRLAPWLVSMLPAHRTYVEPFAGSAAVLFEKPPSRTEILNDRDRNVATYMRVLRDRPADLIRALTYTPYARDEFRAADLDEPGLDELERARRFFVNVCCSLSHSTQATGFAISPNPPAVHRGGADNAHKFVAIVERLDACARRLRTVQIENRPALEIIGRFGADRDAALYCDPPYLADVRSMRTKRPAGGDYGVEYSSEAEHRQLADVLHGCRAAVLLSGYDSPLYRELYDAAGWSRAERSVNVSMANGGGSRPATVPRAVEVVWSNRPLVEQQVLLTP